MKKKVLYGVFLTALACASMGTLQSCKDDLADLKYEVKTDREALRAELAKTKAELQSQITTNAADIADLKDRVKKLEDNSATKEELQNAINDLKAQMATKAALEDALNRIAALEDAISNPETGIKHDLAVLRAELEQLGLDFSAYKTEVQSTFEDVYAQLEANNMYLTQILNLMNDQFDEVNSRIDGVDANLQEIWETLDNHSELIAEVIKQISGLKQEVDDRFAEVNDELALMNADIEAIYEEIDGLRFKNTQLENKIIQTNARIDEVFGYINKMVSGILIQGSYNPLFGDFSLPIGVQSNMLFNWHGYTEQDVTFPSAEAKYAYDGQAPELTTGQLRQALRDLGIQIGGEQIDNGLIFDDDNFGLGELYATVNPVEVNFENTQFTLQTSAGKTLPFKVILEESDDELSFGYSRSTDKTGFYKAKVNFENLTDGSDLAALQTIRIEIDENVKAAAKAFYQDRSKRNAVEVMKALYNSMNGFMPRYALRYDWTSVVDGKTYDNAVLSKYELGVATAKPLSYSFAEGIHGTAKFRHIGTLHNLFSELIGDNYKFNFEDKHLNGITLSYTDLSFELGDQLNNSSINVVLPEITVTDANGVAMTVDYDRNLTINDENGLADFTGDLKAAIEDAINGADGLNDQLKKMITVDMQGQMDNLIGEVNKMLDSMAGEINEKIENIINKLDNNRFMSAVNKVIDIYNNVADHLNAMIENPNHYLQPAFFYEGARRPHVVSTSQYDPTVFVKNGGDAFTIYASSYSAELFAPAYKKFIACTNVFNRDGSTIKDKSVDRTTQVNKDNAGKCFGILPGGYKRITVDASSMTPDYVYEITYQGVDYSGKISTQKFYVTVK